MQRGSVVRSLAGRDKDTLLAVTETDDGYVYVADGKARPLPDPKRKNPRHVTDVDKRLSEDQMRSDKSLRKALAIVKSEIESREETV